MFGLGPEADIPFGSAQDPWVLIDDNEAAGWSAVAGPPSAGWTPVDDSVSTTWTDVDDISWS